MAFANAGGTGTLTKASLDAQMMNIFTGLDGLMNQIQAMEAFFTQNADANFTAAAGGPGPTGYIEADVTTFKSALSDLDQLRQIYQGLATLGTAKDFRTFPKQLWGTGVH